MTGFEHVLQRYFGFLCHRLLSVLLWVGVLPWATISGDITIAEINAFCVKNCFDHFICKTYEKSTMKSLAKMMLDIYRTLNEQDMDL